MAELKLNQELNVAVMPGGALQVEWVETEEKINKSTRLLQNEIYRRFTDDSKRWLLFIGFCNQNVRLTPSLNFWRKFAGLFVGELKRTPDLEDIRHKVQVPFDKESAASLIEEAPLMVGSEYLNAEFLEMLWDRLNVLFSESIASYEGTVEAFIREYSPDVHLVGRIFFHLVENKDEDYPFAFLATYSTRLNKEGKSKHVPLKYALKEYEHRKAELLELLTTVHLAAKKSSFLSNLLETGGLFHPSAWRSSEAFLFLKEVPVYEESGILCRIPNWWKGTASSVSVNISVGGKKPSFVGMDAILNFNASLVLGDTKISEEEAKQLLRESEGLAFIKNKWIAVDPEKLKQTLDAYEKAKILMKEEGLTLKDALRLQLRPEKFLNGDAADAVVHVSNGEWLESVMKKLVDPELISSMKPGRRFKAHLRQYQQKGLDWLLFLHSLGFGACLADDMGLGKTIQVLAFLHVLKEKPTKDKATYHTDLLIVPASLISNWINEINRFYPHLNYLVVHASANPDKKAKKNLNTHDLVITTYALAQKYEWLRSQEWRYIILDEAQAIKNPSTKQAKAIKKMVSQNKIIMTGTPIENSLSDLWSLFDFLNPGLLGSPQEFKQLSRQLKDDPGGYRGLRRLIRPYILRRLKTDKTIISDLPDKIEMKTYADLSKKQILLYDKLIHEISTALEKSEGIQRKGIILASIMKFKQICNHPDQYLGTGEYDANESGKFIRLREICETILEKREKVLVFTQFKEITDPLAGFLEDVFRRKGLVLHGSIPVAKRKDIIERFQGQSYVPFMVLSLKAGGVGLNLTEAGHVIHFDRWWNPAVENQATDRAFRIGQKRNVVVHKFLTRGSIEEKIDKMLEEKSRLSDDVIAATGEKWITEMKNEELFDLFKLTL